MKSNQPENLSPAGTSLLNRRDFLRKPLGNRLRWHGMMHRPVCLPMIIFGGTSPRIHNRPSRSILGGTTGESVFFARKTQTFPQLRSSSKCLSFTAPMIICWEAVRPEINPDRPFSRHLGTQARAYPSPRHPDAEP